jgi:uncharacterized protein YukE
MTTIHMETEKVQALARELDTGGSHMLSNLSQLRSSASRLHVGWQGGNAEDFNIDLSRLLNKIEGQIVTLQNLSVRLSREVDEWIIVDRFESGSSQNIRSELDSLRQSARPADWQAVFQRGGYFLAGFGFTLLDGIHAMYGVARDQFNRQIVLSEGAVQKAIQSSDAYLDEGFTDLLGNPAHGNSESITFQVKGDVSIPGIEVGVPGTFKVEGAKEVSITKENGKYKLVLSNGDGLGIEEPFLPGGGGKLKVGNHTYGGDIDVSAEIMAKNQVEVAYEFDPKKPGDLTKMAAFMYGIGLLNSTTGPLVAPALITLKDNLTSINVSQGVEGNVKADASVLIKVAGLKDEAQFMQGGELRKVAGEWESVQQTELKLEGKASLLTNSAGAEMRTQYETITHSDGSQSVKVIVDLKSEAGKGLKLQDLTQIAPPLKSLQGSDEKYESVKIEYTVDGPLDTVKQMIESPQSGINWDALNKNSTVVIHEMTGSETGYGVSGNLKLPTQKIGLGVEANMIRESSKEIYRSR